MELTLTRSFQITSFDLDAFGLVRPATLMNFFQEAGRLHSIALNLTVEGLHQLGKTWVMAQFRMQISSRPSTDAILSVETWPSSCEEWEVIRDFEISDAAGRPVARASASYVIIDLKTRRAVRIGDLVPRDYQQARRAIPEPALPIPRVTSPQGVLRLPVLFRDLDLNMHVNNVVYAQWAIDSLPIEQWTTHDLASIEIAFKNEIRHPSTIQVACTLQPSPRGLEGLHLITVNDTTEAARIRTTWTRGRVGAG